ncbi:MAG: hypothetical protein HQ492_12115 [Woeseiaceae bacterium]|nr:hypothetical protein [Woeseiaceae bacterium]
MKEFVAKVLAKFIDVFHRIGFFVEMAIPVAAVWISYRVSTKILFAEEPQPFWTYTKAFFLLLALWWLVLKGLTLIIRTTQFVSSGRADPADLLYNANRDTSELKEMHEEGRSADEIRSQIARELRESRRFDRWLSVFFFGALYVVGLAVVAIIT